MDEVDRPFPGLEEIAEEEAAFKAQEEITREEPNKEGLSANGQETQELEELARTRAEKSLPTGSSSGSEADTVSGPSTGEDSQCLPTRTGGPAAFEDEEPATSPPSAKMLIGGRASIPDELQPDQLQKLQNLKESNA